MDYEEADKSALRQHGGEQAKEALDELERQAGIGDVARARNTEELNALGIPVPTEEARLEAEKAVEPKPYEPESDRLMERLEKDDSKKARLAKKWIVLCKVVELSAESDPVDVLTKVYNRGVSDTNEAVHRELEKQNFWRKQQGS